MTESLRCHQVEHVGVGGRDDISFRWRADNSSTVKKERNRLGGDMGRFVFLVMERTNGWPG